MTMLELVVSTYLKLGTMKDERLHYDNTSVTKKHKGCRTRGRPQLIKTRREITEHICDKETQRMQNTRTTSAN